MADVERELKRIYFDPQSPGSYGGVEALKRASQLRRQDITNWLQSQDSYTLHKPVRHKFPRRRVLVGGKNHQFQADLVDVRSIKKQNNGMAYLLTCIDVFSKYAYAVPLKDKTGSTLVEAFKRIFKPGQTPLRLQTDLGSEFRNSRFQSFLKDRKVEFFVSNNAQIKASIVERFNRTLKAKLWRYFTKHNTSRYIDILPFLITSYNNTYHRSIKLAPSQVNSSNQEFVWQNLYGQPQKEDPPSSRLEEGDRVRISKVKRRFEKGYLPSWTEELFTVSRIRRRTNPIAYTLKADDGTELIGSFYRFELQKVADKEIYRIAEILRQRMYGREKQYLVSWAGYPASFCSWIPARSIQRYE